MRKLGIKNICLFVLLAILVFVILLIFFFGIRYVLNLDTSTYTLQKGSFLYDDDFNYIEVEDDAILKKSFDNAFYLTMLTDGISQKYKIGPSTVVYNDADYKMYLYGTFYQVSTSGEVQKLTKMTEVVKANVPQFYKIADRKYLWIDSTFTSTSGLNTDEYLIIELDKQGNATLANHEMYEKTINPMVIKGSLYDFDVVHEKLILTDREIDLKNIIGSSNEYQDPVEEEEEETTTTDNSYYDDYFEQLVNSFNNLTGNINDFNEQQQQQNNEEQIHLDLTRWVSLKSVDTSVNSLTVNYQVFDPNNEYNAIFLILQSEGVEAKKIYLNKENTSYTIRDLVPNTEYTVTFGYQLAKSVDELETEVTDDVVKIKTDKPNYQLAFTKITSSKLYYELKVDSLYQLESGTIRLYSDNQVLAEQPIDVSKITNGVYTGSFDNQNLGYFIEIRVEDFVYNGQLINNFPITSKYINQ